MDGSRPVIARAAVIAAARGWIGTPYVHQASVRRIGCDCLGLIRGLWRELVGPEPEAVPPYTPDWAERAGAETLLRAARRHLAVRPVSAARPGDVLLFRMAAGAPAKHAGVMSAPDRLIHAYWGKAVTETALTPWWRRRLAAAGAFPNVED